MQTILYMSIHVYDKIFSKSKRKIAEMFSTSGKPLKLTWTWIQLAKRERLNRWTVKRKYWTTHQSITGRTTLRRANPCQHSFLDCGRKCQQEQPTAMSYTERAQPQDVLWYSISLNNSGKICVSTNRTENLDNLQIHWVTLWVVLPTSTQVDSLTKTE